MKHHYVKHTTRPFFLAIGLVTLLVISRAEGKLLDNQQVTITLYPLFKWQFRQFSTQTDSEALRFKLKSGNNYGPEIIEIDGDTQYNFDFLKRH